MTNPENCSKSQQTRDHLQLRQSNSISNVTSISCMILPYMGLLPPRKMGRRSQNDGLAQSHRRVHEHTTSAGHKDLQF